MIDVVYVCTKYNCPTVHKDSHTSVAFCKIQLQTYSRIVDLMLYRCTIGTTTQERYDD